MKNGFFFSFLWISLIFWLFTACSPEKQSTTGVPLSRTLSEGDTTGFLRAVEPRTFQFPDDHAPHNGFKTEWWYVTANVDAADGRRFGIQFTLFRIAMRQVSAVPDSDSWQASHFWMGHAALTDAGTRRFYHEERFSREARGMAGFSAGDTSSVFLGNWKLNWESNDFAMQAGGDGFSMAFSLEPQREPVLQGKDGLSQKGAGNGNASYYYSITRLAAAGILTVGDEEIPVNGLAWVDREWSTSMLENGALGWDWFSLQLSDGSDLMYYQLRDSTGRPTPYSRGMLLRADGKTDVFQSSDVELTTSRYWTAPGGGKYPVDRVLTIKTLGISLQISPVFDGQELRTAVRYWEGAIDVSGKSAGQPVTGRGYLEMTGYAGDSRSPDR